MNNMQQMLINAQKMQRQMKKAQDELALKDFTVNKNGIVTVTIKGDKTVSKIEVDKDAFNEDDKEMVEESIKLALNELFETVDKENEAIENKLTGSMKGFPF